MSLLNGPWRLLDVDDVEALAWKLIRTSGPAAELRPHQRDDLCAHVIEAIWEGSLSYDPKRQVRFSTFAYVVGQRSIAGWFRSSANGFGRTRWVFRDRVYERPRVTLVSYDEERENFGPGHGHHGSNHNSESGRLGRIVAAQSSDPAADCDPDLERLLAGGSSTRTRDLAALGLEPPRRAA